MIEARPIERRLASPRDAPEPGAHALWRMQESTSTRLLEIRDLHVQFQTRERSVTAVNGLSFGLQAGRSLAIVGESGSGKSASCRALIGLLPRSAVVSGSVRFLGAELLDLTEAELRSYRGSGIAMAFQDSDNALNPTMRVGDQISEAICLHTGLDRRAAKHKAIELMGSLKIQAPEHRIHAYPHELSGGMKQRVMLAVALAGDPKLLIADESTRALDVKTQTDIMWLIEDARRNRGMALIFVSHDLRLAAKLADDVLVMYAGSALEYASTEQLFRHPRSPYTRALLDAMSELDGDRRSGRTVASNEIVNRAGFSVGCPYEPRCPSATALCRRERPPLEQRAGHHWSCWNA